MLRFVTQKLKSQSLNEVNQPFDYKSDDDDRDSGTESDDENTEYDDSKEATENERAGVVGERRSFSGMIHPSRPPNFDEETSTGSPDDLQYGSGHHHHHHFVAGSTFRGLPSSMQLETNDESAIQPRITRAGRRLAARNELRLAAGIVDQSSAGENFVNTSSSHIPSPVSSSVLDVDSALPSDSDHFEHQSSEEELDGFIFKVSTPTTLTSLRSLSRECTPINLSLTSDDDDDGEDEKACRQRSTPHGRRSSRLSAANQTSKCKPNILSENNGTTKTTNKKRNGGLNGSTAASYQPEKRKWSQANRRSCYDSSADSSDEEVRDLMYVCSPSSPPVEFCTSPPAELIRPTRSSLNSKLNSSANLTPAPSLFSAASANSNNNNNNNLISTTTTNFSAFSFISVSLPCSQSPFLSSDTGISNATRSPPAKLFQFSSSNFIPFEVCAVSPRKRHRQNVSSCHYQHYPHQLQQQNQFQPVNGGGNVNGAVAEQNSHFSNVSNDRISSGNIINQFSNTLITSNATDQRRNNNNGQSSGQHNQQPLRQRPCLDFEKMQQVRSRQMSHMRRRCRN